MMWGIILICAASTARSECSASNALAVIDTEGGAALPVACIKATEEDAARRVREGKLVIGPGFYAKLVCQPNRLKRA